MLRFIVPVLVLAVGQCGAMPPATPAATSQLPAAAPANGQPLTATKGPGTVTIKEGDKVLATIQTASPNVEETRWHAEQEQIVVKSRGNHGPATVQLFNSRDGKEIARIKAYEIRDNQPAWAAGMGE